MATLAKNPEYGYYNYIDKNKEHKMMKQMMIGTVGIPGCGKSSWAIEFQKRNPDYITIVERDILRAKFYTDSGNRWDYKMTKAKENDITIMQEDLIRAALADGETVIVSDTNLNENTRNRLFDIAQEFGIEIHWQVFDIPLFQAMKQNVKRAEVVPEAVLIRMHMALRKFQGKYVQQRPDRKERMMASCVIFDIDGTLADMKGIRGPFDWDKVGLDKPIQHIVDYQKFLYGTKEHNVFIFSGRDGSCRDLTEAWLEEYGIHHDGLFMREAGNTENDSIIKEQLFDKHIKDRYSVNHIVDDRAQVCKNWESMGFRVMNVGGFLADF